VTRRVLAIDPGLRATGLACLEDGVLLWCALARSKDSGTGDKRHPDVYGVLDVSINAAMQYGDWYRTRNDGWQPDLVVVEWPVVRRFTGKAEDRKDPNDLLPLPAVDMTIVTHLITLGFVDRRRAKVRPVLADDWTNVKKEVRQRRYLNGLARPYDLEAGAELTKIEAIKPASLRHNTIDAVMLGKWASEPMRFSSLDRSATPAYDRK
jgi:hypothetical protein